MTAASFIRSLPRCESAYSCFCLRFCLSTAVLISALCVGEKRKIEGREECGVRDGKREGRRKERREGGRKEQSVDIKISIQYGSAVLMFLQI